MGVILNQLTSNWFYIGFKFPNKHHLWVIACIQDSPIPLIPLTQLSPPLFKAHLRTAWKRLAAVGLESQRLKRGILKEKRNKGWRLADSPRKRKQKSWVWDVKPRKKMSSIQTVKPGKNPLASQGMRTYWTRELPNGNWTWGWNGPMQIYFILYWFHPFHFLTSPENLQMILEVFFHKKINWSVGKMAKLLVLLYHA
jgi:hypothetical protein